MPVATSNKKMSKKKKIPLSLWRQLSQTGCLVLFLFLFIKTDYTGSDQLEYAVNILFRLDPLIALCTTLAAKTFISLLLPSLFLLGLSLVLGRFFCGWACPMGTLLDLANPLFRKKNRPLATVAPKLRYRLLCFLLIAAFCGLPLVGYLDPFSILVRGLTLSLYPAFHETTVSFFTFTYKQAPEAVNAVTEPIYSLLRHTVLPFSQKFYELAFLSFFILIAVFLLELWQRRFFCRNLCPLGALLGLLGHKSLLHGHGGDAECKKCRTCRSVCRMGAIDQERTIHMDQCTLCLECLDKCPRSVIAFSAKKPLHAAPSLSLSRRVFVGSVAAGAVTPLFSGVRGLAKTPDPQLIRPPGALAEKEFLGRCVRCGECMKVCIGNALQPTFLEAGMEGMFSPRVLPRLGYCEFNCTLCGQVCPTGAISELQLSEKHLNKIGHAFFDKNLCLPFAKAMPCIVCEEHCPTPDKAIKFKEVTMVNDQGLQVTVKQPYIVDALCIGCGICENKCPIPGKAAVRITSAGEHREPDHALPSVGNSSYP